MKKLTKGIIRQLRKHITTAKSQGGTSVISHSPGTSGTRPISRPTPIKYLDFDHLEITCGNPKQSALYYSALFGFEVRQCEDIYDKSGQIRYLLVNGGVRIMLRGSVQADSDVNEVLTMRGDSVTGVGLGVEDLDDVVRHLSRKKEGVEADKSTLKKTIPGLLEI